MGQEREAALEDLNVNEEDATLVMKISAPSEKTILLLGKSFNLATYSRRKYILDTIEEKSKVKEILQDQPDSLIDLNNQYFFISHFEKLFSKNITVIQKSKSLFAKLSIAQGHSKMDVRNYFPLVSEAKTKILTQEDFPKHIQ